MFDENAALLQKKSISVDLKATDWTFEQGHRLGVQIGTITESGWRDVPSGHTIKIAGARLRLDVQSPRLDVPTQGDRSPYVDQYIAANTTTLTDIGPATFPLEVPRG